MSYLEERRLRKQGLAPKLPTKKEPKPLKKVSDKRKMELASEKAEKGDSGLDKYFDYHMEHSQPVCEECGMVAMWLKEEKYKSVWRMCHHHVLPKKNSIGGFPSVSTRLENHLVLFPSLGGKLCGCHAHAESSYENLAKMKIFPKVIDIISILWPSVPAAERRFLPDTIIQEIKPTIYNQ